MVKMHHGKGCTVAAAAVSEYPAMLKPLKVDLNCA
jgi:hydroxymethylpyrimidine/phosphomethylpyrimidine kinase